MSDSVRPHRRQPTRLPRPWDSPGKNTGVGCHFLLQCMKVKSESEVTQSCPTLSDPMDCSPPGPSIYGIFQARVLEWGAIAFSAPNIYTPLIQNNPGNALPSGSSIKSLIRLWPFVSLVSTNDKGVKMNFISHMLSFCPLTMSTSQHKQDQILFSEQQEHWRRQIERRLRTGSRKKKKKGGGLRSVHTNTNALIFLNL